MENLRWVLIIAGVAILVLLWFSGRGNRRRATTRELPDTLLDDEPGHTFNDDSIGDLDHISIDGDDMARPGDPMANQPGRTAFAPAPNEAGSFDTRPADVDYAGAELSGGELAGNSFAGSDFTGVGHDDSRNVAQNGARNVGLSDGLSGGLNGGGLGLGSLARKFETFGARLAPKRRQRVAAMDEGDTVGDERGGERQGARATRIVTLHVVAPEGEILPPEALRAEFTERGYHHGDMNIFHSMSEGTTVYSVARMVKPGYFDLDDISTFETPGISFILQLPGPVVADTAFEVMLSEAHGMAEALGAAVLDDSHSALGRQTEQHLRDSIYEFMHRQKFADGVAG